MDTYNFCPKCGSKAERKLPNLLVCQNCTFNFYINPASTNAVILENSKGEILLVKRKFDPMKGYLDLPGGFIEAGESLEESTIREAKEEIGIDISSVAYFTSYPDEYLYQEINMKTLTIILTGKIIDELKLKAADDVEEILFFKKSDLPFEKIAFEGIRKGLIDYLKKE